MLTNSLYLEEQLTEEDIEEYLRRISTLIRRDEVRRTREKTILEYGKPNGNNLSGTTWGHEGDSMKLDEFNKKKRKCFKCGKVGHIRRFYRSKENLLKEKKDTLAVFEELENEIPKWLEDLKKVFGTIPKEKLSSSRDEVDHEIVLKTKKIKSLPLILTRLKEQEIVKEYLNEMTKKE